MPAVLATPVAATNTAAQLVRAVGLTPRRSSIVRHASLRHAATTVATWVREVEVVVVGAIQRSSELEACCLFSFVPLYRGRTLSSCLTVAAQRPFYYVVHCTFWPGSLSSVRRRAPFAVRVCMYTLCCLAHPCQHVFTRWGVVLSCPCCYITLACWP